MASIPEPTEASRKQMYAFAKGGKDMGFSNYQSDEDKDRLYAAGVAAQADVEQHPSLQEQSERVHRDILAHLEGIHGDSGKRGKTKRSPFWETSLCHGTFPCDYLNTLTKEREALAAAIQQQYTQEYRDGLRTS